MRIGLVSTDVDRLVPRIRDECRAPPWSSRLNSAARHPWGTAQAAGGRGKAVVAAQSACHTALHHPLLGAWEGEIVPVGAYLSGVLHALWGATTAAPRRRAAQAAPQGCLAAEFSLEGHGGALDVSPILGPR